MMDMIKKAILFAFFLSAIEWLPVQPLMDRSPAAEPGVPILAYHRFGPSPSDSMTVTTQVFESHLQFLQENGYRALFLRDLVEFGFKKGFPPECRWVGMTADDAHISVYAIALPLIKKYRIPMTLFVYPSAVSNASYAMTWAQLRELKATGLFDFQSHTYWHPNFNKERKRLAPAEFEKLVDMQLKKSKEKLEKELGVRISMLAWPFGIHDPWLMNKAAEAGYAAAFTIEGYAFSKKDHPMAIPRYLMADSHRGKAFERIVHGSSLTGKKGNGNGKKS
ncbi:MAG: polysaccharide deacetylase family protein [Syntrophaceae bacterium]|nr:polysaccharide deacetylase family protein [Syntrophaceae bacterium]